MTPKNSAPSTGVDEAIGLLLEQVRRSEPQLIDLDHCLGLVLAKRLVSRELHPAEDTSAMDGYAVRSEDLEKASPAEPVSLTQVEDIRAGFPPERVLSSGQNSRISTGGLLPRGADAVVMREDVDADGEGTVRFFAPVARGQNIRYAGEHLKLGETGVEENAVLGSAEIGMAAYLGYDKIWCYPKVKVAVLATGSELVESGVELSRGQIRDSNGAALVAALNSVGCEVCFRARVPDSPEALDSALSQAFDSSEVVITSGGISAGWHDLVRKRIEKLGGSFSFHKLRMRPGKPIAFGQCGASHFFCLPGNPVSTLVTFEVFAKPALLKMMGRSEQAPIFKAELTQAIQKKSDFTIFYRGVMQEDENGRLKVRLTGPQGSHLLRSLVEANVLIRAEEGQECLEAGSMVSVYKLS